MYACNTRGKESTFMLEALYTYNFIIVSNHQQQYGAYSSLVQKDDFIRSIKSDPNGKQSHMYEQVVKTIFAILQPKQYVDN